MRMAPSRESIQTKLGTRSLDPFLGVTSMTAKPMMPAWSAVVGPNLITMTVVGQLFAWLIGISPRLLRPLDLQCAASKRLHQYLLLLRLPGVPSSILVRTSSVS